MRLALTAALTLLAVCSPAVAQQNELTPEEQELFRWFDTLGYPDLKTARYATVATGGWSQTQGEGPVGDRIRAFVLQEADGVFTILDSSLNTRELTVTPAGTPEHERVGFEVLDFESAAQERLTALRLADREDHFRRFGSRLGEAAEIVAFARACARRGLTKIAHELCVEASKLPVRSGKKAPSLRKRVEGELGHAAMWQGILAFGDKSVPRSELLKRFERIVKLFPGSEHAERATRTRDLLKRMVAEDAEHAKRPAPGPKAPVAERVAHLIFRLRDQNGSQISQPGSCDIFNDRPNSPAHQLVALGHEAVPQLIETLDDPSFTRSVGYHRNFYFSHRVLTVGSCALRILQRIAGRRFWAQGNQSAKDRVTAWWKELQTKGSKQVLIDAVVKGDDDAGQQALRLLTEHPKDALQPIGQGMRASKNAWIRARLVSIVARIPGQASTDVLLDELQHGPLVRARLEAAWALHKREQGVAADLMIEAWHELDGAGDDLAGVLQFLSRCDSPHAIDALGERLTARPVKVRMAVVTALGPTGRLGGLGFGLRWLKPREAPKGIVGARTEHLLVQALADGGVTKDGARVSDTAATVLASFWPDRYTFDATASYRRRERARVECQNAYREEQGLALLPLPAERAVEPAAAEVVEPLLKALDDPKARASALDQLEDLGLAALPHVQARPDLRELAQHLHHSVSEVVLLPDSAKLTAPYPAWDAVAKGPLYAAEIRSLLIALSQKAPPGVRGVRLTAERRGEDPGVTLLTRWIPGPVASPRGTSYSFLVQLDGKQLLNMGGGSSLGHARKPEAYQQIAEAIEEVTTAAPGVPYTINLSFELE